MILNAHHDVVDFKLPRVTGGTGWLLLLDTNQPDLEQTPQFEFEHEYASTGRSVLLLELEPDGSAEAAPAE